MVDAMQKLAKDDDLRDQLGENGFQAFQQFWSEERHLRYYFQMIDLITKGQLLRAAL